MIAMTGVLFMKAERNVTGIIILIKAVPRQSGVPRMKSKIASKQPVSDIPVATAKRTATVKGAVFANPAKPSSTLTILVTIKMDKTPVESKG